MSTLKVNKLRDTTGSTDAIVLDPSGGAVLAGVTTISTARITTGITTSIQVGGGVTISESGIEASGIGITCANINGAQIGGRRNIIINGAMQVAQRGTSSTSSGYQTVDRFPVFLAGTDEAPTQAQVDVAAGTTPYTSGFRKALKVTNGNQTSGANSGSTQYVWIQHKIEAQNIASSGWNYLSSSSFITLSFWVKSSVAQTFKGYIETIDGTAYQYPFETGSLSANTWTKITKNIPGNSNLTFNHDNGEGFKFSIVPFISNNKTESSVTEDAWGTYNSSARMKDSTTTWYETNDATFELTGVQLEVGSQATAFEHLSVGEDLALCQRYFERIVVSGNEIFFFGVNQFGSGGRIPLYFKVTKRAIPTVSIDNASFAYYAVQGSGSNGSASFTVNSYSTDTMGITSSGAGANTSWWTNKSSDGYVDASAEL